MADKSTPLVLAALTKAVAEPVGMPLHGKKKMAGLFAATASAKQAAQRCLDEGYLRVFERQTRGKSIEDVCTITEKGLAYLLSQVNPKPVLEELVRTLQAHQTQVAELVAATRQWQAGLDGLQTAVAKVLDQIQQPGQSPLPSAVGAGPALRNGSATLAVDVIACLGRWQASGSAGDCPLPELYARAHAGAPSLTIGRFHDTLRQLHEHEQIYLHPWSGPLYEIPEPSYAVLVGHEVAYYASIREEAGRGSFAETAAENEPRPLFAKEEMHVNHSP
jgi:hypothetical protein